MMKIFGFIFVWSLSILGVFCDTELPDFIVENVGGQDFLMDDIVGEHLMEEVAHMDSSGQKTANEVREMLCRDLMEASEEVLTRARGRTLQPRYCATFCLDFYSWCRTVCSRLIKEQGSRYLEILPCLSACTMHLASCCFA